MLHPLLALLLVALLALRPTSLAGTPPPPGWDPNSVPDAFSRPTAALMWPGASRAFCVDAAGNMANGAWRIDIVAGAGGRPAGSPARIAYEDRWLPVAHWSERAGEVRWDFEAVALPIPDDALTVWGRNLAAWRDQYDGSRRREPARSTAENMPLVVTVQAIARNEGTRAEPVSLDVTLAPLRQDDGLVARGAAARMPSWGWSVAGSDSAIAWADRAAQGRSLRHRVTLEPGQSTQLRFIAASHPMGTARLAAWARVPHETRVRTARDWWTLELSRGMKLKLADPEVEAAVRASRAVLLSCRERRAGQWVALDELFPARGASIEGGARAAAALAAHGYVSEARAIAEGFLSRPQEHGAFNDASGAAAATGQAVWALGQALLRPTPSADMAPAKDAAFAAWQWGERRRHAARTGVATDAWALAGYSATERLLRAAGRDADADRVAASRRGLAIAYARATARQPAPGATGGLNATATADLGVQALRSGRRAEAEAALARLLGWRNATGAGADELTRDGDFGLTPPPGVRAAAALLQLVRNDLLDDDSERLCLTQGARPRWWRGARVDGAPTRWGTISLAFDRTLDHARWRWTPVPVWTELSLPPGTQVAGELAAPLQRSPRPDAVLAPPGTQQARVNLEPARRVPSRSPGPRTTSAARADLADSRP